MKQNRLAILGTFLVLGASMWFLTSQLNASKRTSFAGKEKAPVELVSTSRQTLPAYRMTNVNEQEIPADELSHGRVLLVYMTTACEPCVKQARIISRLNEVNSSNVRIYGVSFERPAQVATFVKEFDLKFPMLIDRGSQLARSLDIHYFPSTYLVEDGVITKVWRGVTRDEADLHNQLKSQ
jgi:peroxiredoxin